MTPEVENRKLFVRRRRTWISVAIAATVSSFLVGLILPWNRHAQWATSQPTPGMQTQNRDQQPTNNNSSLSSPLPRGSAGGKLGSEEVSVQANDAFRKVVDQLEQEVRLTFSVPAQFQGKTIKEAKLSSKDKVIALTFDDGPWAKWTEKILDILQKNNIKATFFMVGEVVQEYPQLAKLVVADGHAVGNHTWTHPYRNFDEAGASREIDRTSEIIYKTTGAKTALFRPPGGHLTNGLAAYAEKQKYVVAMWSADSIDYRRPGPERLARNVLRDAKPGGIVLMHDGGGDRSHTVQALPQIIKELKKQGYKFVTLPELLEMQDKEQTVTAAKPN